MFREDLFKGETLLVTGGGSGLGRSMTARLLDLGAQVVICGRREQVLQESQDDLAKAHPGRIHFRVCDIRDPAAIDAMLEDIWGTIAPLDGLVNNAAGNFIAKTETLSPRALDAVLNIVLHGTAYMTLACGKRWLAQKRAARVLSIVTSYAWTGSSYVVPSAMAKAGVLAMTRSLAVEWGGRGLRLNAIAPGAFPTPGAWERLVPRPDLEETWRKRIPLGRFGAHQELADLAAFLLSPMAGYINGDCITIDGGEWLKGAGQFSFVEMLSEEDWAALRKKD